MSSLQDADQRLANIESELQTIRALERAFVIKWKLQNKALSDILALYQHLLETKQISPSYHAQQKSTVDTFYDQINQWAHFEEDVLMNQLYNAYPTVHGEPININLGKLEFRSSSSSPSDEYAIKFSRVRKESNTEDPVREAWLCNFTGKDFHRRMLPLMMACTLRQTFIMITPKARGTDLFKFISAEPAKARQMAKPIFEQLCYSLDYLHNHLGVAHLDIKPENVFLDEELMPILGDFGMAHAADFPRHAHNNPQGFKFYYARFITNKIRSTIGNQCIDEAPLSVLPQFSLPLPAFQRQVEYYRTLTPPLDFVNLIDSISYGLLPEMPPPAVEMGDGEAPPQPPAEPSIYTFSDYLRYLSSEEMAARGSTIDPEEYFNQHFDQSAVSRQQFFDYVNEKFLSAHESSMRLTYTQIHLVPNLDPKVYSQLTPDLSTLAVRPVTTTLGTRAYMAPEVFSNSPSFDCMKADIYSLGVVFFILVFGFPPYRNSYLDERHPDYDQAYARLHLHYSHPPPPANGRNQGVTKLISDYGKAGQVHVSVTNLLDRMMDFNFRTRISLKRIITEFLPRLVL